MLLRNLGAKQGVLREICKWRMETITLEWLFFTSSINTLGRLCVFEKTKVEIITNYCLEFCFSYDSCINKQVGIPLHGHPIFFS